MFLYAISVIMILGVFSTIMLNKIREDHFHRNLKELVSPLAVLLVNQVKHVMTNHKPDHFQEILKEFRGDSHIYSVKIVDSKGVVHFSSDSTMIDSVMEIPDISKFEKTRISSLPTYFIPSDAHDYIDLITVIENSEECYQCHKNKDEPIGYVDVRINHRGEKIFENIIVLYDFFGFLILIMLFIFTVTYFHHRYFQKPFSVIKAGLQDIQKGKLDTQIKVNTRGELNYLAENINAMAASLLKARDELKGMHQKQLERVSQLVTVGELAAGVAHEIKNPISGIKNALEILRYQIRELENNDIYQEMMLQADRVLKTIQDLVFFARPRTPEMKPMDIHQVLDQTINFHSRHLRSKDMILKKEYSVDVPQIYADSELLKQVFSNLIINAIHATESADEGRITIKTDFNEARGKIRIIIKDNGSGIPPENLKKVFTPFYTTKAKGTGLGLSLSRSIIMNHHGEIVVNSTPGEGTEFIIILPIVHPENE